MNGGTIAVDSGVLFVLQRLMRASVCCMCLKNACGVICTCVDTVWCVCRIECV